MILSFHIEYRTSWGEEVRVLGSIPELGNNQPGKAVPLQTVDGIHWTLDADIQAPENGIVQYSYHIYRDGKDTRTEWNSLPRTLYVSADKKKVYRLQDCWKNLPEQQYFYTSAFTESLLAHPERSAAPKSHKKGLVIKAYAPCIDNDHCLGICGNQKVLGDWDADKAVLMSDSNFPEWQVEVDASKISFPLEYKFILYNKKEHRAVAWENNPNRYMADPQIGANETLVIGDRYVYFALPDWKGAGVAVPIFSLRSEKSFGVGDFGDLRQMIDWAVLTRQKAVQILPINDTTMTHTWTDSYPYSSISIYAFHPMYADLKQMGTLKDKEKMAEFKKRQKELNALSTVDYEAVNQTRTILSFLENVQAQGTHPSRSRFGSGAAVHLLFVHIANSLKATKNGYNHTPCSAIYAMPTRRPTSANGRNSPNIRPKKLRSCVNLSPPTIHTLPSTSSSSSTCTCNCWQRRNMHAPTV